MSPADLDSHSFAVAVACSQGLSGEEEGKARKGAHKSSKSPIMPKKRKLRVNFPRRRGGASICKLRRAGRAGRIMPRHESRTFNLGRAARIFPRQAEVCSDVTPGAGKAAGAEWGLLSVAEALSCGDRASLKRHLSSGERGRAKSFQYIARDKRELKICKPPIGNFFALVPQNVPL